MILGDTEYAGDRCCHFGMVKSCIALMPFYPRSLVKLDPILCDCLLEKNEQHVVMKLPWDGLLTRYQGLVGRSPDQV